MKNRKRIQYYSPKRRAVYAQGDPIDALALFDKCNWTCGLCGKSIDKNRRVPDWRAATIEHIIPISKGGTHTWNNVTAAHYRCNLMKSDLVWDSADVILGV